MERKYSGHMKTDIDQTHCKEICKSHETDINQTHGTEIDRSHETDINRTNGTEKYMSIPHGTEMGQKSETEMAMGMWEK